MTCPRYRRDCAEIGIRPLEKTPTESLLRIAQGRSEAAARLLLRRLFHPHQQPLLGAILSKVNQQGALGFGKGEDRAIEYPIRLIADRPGGALPRLIPPPLHPRTD